MMIYRIKLEIKALYKIQMELNKTAAGTEQDNI